jgi:hypothetical protein
MYRSDPTTSHKSQNHLSERKVVPPHRQGFPAQKRRRRRKTPVTCSDLPETPSPGAPDLSPLPLTGAPDLSPMPSTGAGPVTYAIDPDPDLSPTPETPVGPVNGVADRMADLSLA